MIFLIVKYIIHIEIVVTTTIPRNRIRIERMARSAERHSDSRAGIQSVEVAAQLLDAMAAAPGSLALKDIAAAAGMPASKAHRYLVSLCRTGMMEQDPATGRYDFGRFALAVGLAALGRIDVVAVATGTLRRLSDRTGATAVLAVWGQHGPTVIRFEESAQPVRMNVRVGSTLPATRSAIGQIFAAFLPDNLTRELIAAERQLFGTGSAPTQFDKIFEDVRNRRLNRNVGTYIPGVTALAAPVFDAQGRLAAVIGLLGHEASLDASWTGPVMAVLGETAVGASARLGFSETLSPAPS